MDINNQAGLKGVKLAGSKGIPIVIMEGLLGGRLAKAPANVQALYDAFPIKRSPVEWAFRYLYDRREIVTILSGMSNDEQLEDNIRIFESAKADCLSKEEKELLKNVRLAYEARVKIGCTGCEYCQPCPQEIKIPHIFRRYDNCAVFGGFEKLYDRS